MLTVSDSLQIKYNQRREDLVNLRMDDFARLEKLSDSWGNYLDWPGLYQWFLLNKDHLSEPEALHDFAEKFSVCSYQLVTSGGERPSYIIFCFDLLPNAPISAVHAEKYYSQNPDQDSMTRDDNLRAAFDAADLGSCSLDLRTFKAEMSPGYRKQYGLAEKGEITWEMVLEAVDPAYLEEVNRVLIEAANNGMPIDCTYPIKHLRTGERKWMRVVGKVQKGVNGRYESIQAVVMDVTTKMEQEKLKNDFISMISHELKTPLTSIKGYVQVLKYNYATARENPERVLARMERQLRRMTDIINAFLNVSRLESGKIELNKTQFNLADLVAEIQADYLSFLSSHELVFTGIEPCLLQGDQDKIGQVLHNLLSNAVKYSAVGTQIFIDCHRKRSSIVISVRDLGVGIDKESLPKLFDRYFKIQNDFTSTISGFGIGLYLSTEIVALHKGRVWADSEPGVGTTVSFELPL
ncbi:PAS domain-containing sensor histidine kinase [Pedobacter soli]|uniref:sensor histidine kinase n=1 Tax=Pedobacter soli TaxID=390242 RepID=UPI0014288CE1|nr:PAS domain-containing sensor histidine kinase [Pedobacter soli]